MKTNDRDQATVNGPMLAVDNPALRPPQRGDEPIILRLAAGGSQSTGLAGHLAVFVGGADSYAKGRLPVAGRYERRGELLTFTPAFGFVPGQDYVARSRCNGEQDVLTEFRIPTEAVAAPAHVTAVYPSGDVLPENVLRFYVHFSVPMAPHRACDFVTLRNASGVADPAAFMRFKQELWNADRTRLTVLIDPGRIKRSVATNLDLGPALVEGERYALTVDEGWPSADGRSALPAFSKRFRVTEALRERPDVSRWAWTSPRPGTRQAMQIAFDRPFDRHGLSGALHVATGDGEIIAGTGRTGETESSWSFTPDQPWIVRDIRIVVDDALEDVAGNNFRQLLDRELPTQTWRQG